MTQLDPIGAAVRRATRDHQIRLDAARRDAAVQTRRARRATLVNRIVLLCLLAGIIIGCKGGDIAAALKGEPTPSTEFMPPEKVAPVAPPVASATTQAADARGRVIVARDTASTLTPANVESRRPGLLNVLGLAIGSLDELTAKLATANAAAKSSDAAVLRMTDVILSTQQLVLTREAELKAREELRVKQVAELTKQLDAARRAASDEARKDLNRILQIGVVAGGFAIAAGVWLLIKGKDEAIYVIGGGAVSAGLGFAGIYFGREIAQAAIIGSIGAVIVAAILAVQRWKQATAKREAQAKSIVQGVEQAKIAGAISPYAWDRVKAHLEMAAQPGVDDLVKAETK